MPHPPNPTSADVGWAEAARTLPVLGDTVARCQHASLVGLWGEEGLQLLQAGYAHSAAPPDVIAPAAV